MICYKKVAIAVLILIIFAVCSVMIYNINHIFPNPENIPHNQGDTVVYKGLSVEIGELELYQEEELETAYPELISNIDYRYLGENDSVCNYMIVNIKVKNTTNQDIRLGKESIVVWTLETGKEAGTQDLAYFMAFNPDYDGSFEADEEMELKLPFLTMDKYLSWETLKKRDIKIIYSYYPSKNYILYKAEEREK